MKKIYLLYLLLILSWNFILNDALRAQHSQVSEEGFYELKENFNHLNGPDYTLLNGRQYRLLDAGNSHPYFNTDRYRPGSLVLNGESYDSIAINYDIYDQQLILQYPGTSDQDLLLVLNREMIDHFQIDGLSFRLMSFPETGRSFFQVLGSDEMSCFLLWKKILHQSAVSGNTSYKYSKQSREVYFQREGRLYLVRGSSSFTDIFDEAYRKEIKEFIHREKIRFRNASDEKLVDLLNFCMELTDSG